MNRGNRQITRAEARKIRKTVIGWLQNSNSMELAPPEELSYPNQYTNFINNRARVSWNRFRDSKVVSGLTRHNETQDLDNRSEAILEMCSAMVGAYACRQISESPHVSFAASKWSTLCVVRDALRYRNLRRSLDELNGSPIDIMEAGFSLAISRQPKNPLEDISKQLLGRSAVLVATHLIDVGQMAGEACESSFEPILAEI